MKKKILSFLSFLPTLVFAQVDLKKDLILHLPFNGDTYDVSSNANDAYNYGATLTTDQWGNLNSAYRFDGKSYMRIPYNGGLEPKGAFTMAAKVFVEGFNEGRCHANAIISKDYRRRSGDYTLWFTPATNNDCDVQDTLHQVYSGFYGNDAPTFAQMDNPPYVLKGQWDCLICTFDGSKGRMYVNGVLRYEYTTSAFLGHNAADITLGRDESDLYPFWFKGKIDDVRLYNRVLNAAELDSVCSTVDTRLSIHEPQQGHNRNFFANPVTSNLTLNIPPNEMGGTLTVVDLSGRTLINISSVNETSVDVAHFTNGIYIVHYTVGKTYRVAKMIKAN